jgi:hypothetical protein
MLAAAMAAFYLQTGIAEAYQLLVERKVPRQRMACEDVWHMYGHSIGDATEASWKSLLCTHRIIVPGISVPFPCQLI